MMKLTTSSYATTRLIKMRRSSVRSQVETGQKTIWKNLLVMVMLSPNFSYHGKCEGVGAPISDAAELAWELLKDI